MGHPWELMILKHPELVRGCWVGLEYSPASQTALMHAEARTVEELNVDESTRVFRTLPLVLVTHQETPSGLETKSGPLFVLMR